MKGIDKTVIKNLMKLHYYLLLLLLLILFIASCKKGYDPSIEKLKIGTVKNYIDSIQTTDEIEKLMTSIHGKFYDFKINDKVYIVKKEFQKFADSIKVKAIVKADFDNNGLTDILVTAREDRKMGIYCVLDLGKGKYELISISRYFKDIFSLATVEMYRGIPLICYYSIDSYYKWINNSNGYSTQIENKTLTKQKLIYKYGNFIEMRENPANHDIAKIEYETGPCFGPCPIYKLILNIDKTGIYEIKGKIKIEHFKTINGLYKTTIDEVHFNEIINLLNYIDFVKLENEYKVGGTDLPTCYLKITYDGGKIKKISDYGFTGTFGLAWVYALLDRIRDNQNWE